MGRFETDDPRALIELTSLTVFVVDKRAGQLAVSAVAA
jgi:hypothetical protein